MKSLTIIDTFGFFFRLYYAMSGLKNKEGKPSGMVHGFANFIHNLKNDFPSDYIVFALDSGGKTFRSEIDPNYKANRTSPPDELKAQLPVCIEMIEKMGLCSLRLEGYEADDIIASFVKNNKDKELEIRVVTHDKDLYQLISPNVFIYSPAKKELYDRAGCYEKYGVYPEQVRDFLALCGDSADNIPGVKGIGEKGAKKLLDEFGSIENLYENLSQVRNERTKNMLFESKENAFISKRLATLYDELDTPNLDNAKFPQTNPLLKITDILEDYSLNRLLTQIQNTKDEKKLSFTSVLITDENKLVNLVESITEDTLISFDTETTGVDAKSAKIVGFSFCFNEQISYYVPLTHSYLGCPKQISLETAKWAISQIYKGFVVGQNLKYDFRIIKNNFDLNPPKNYADTMILAWLYDPSSAVGMDSLALRLYDYKTIKFEDVVAKGETFASVECESAAKYASEDAWITLRFYKTFLNLLEPNLLKIAREVEFDFILTLFDMESNGIRLNTDKLRELISSNEAALKSLTNEIYELCGEKFNINSTKQLGVVLFENLKLPTKKKTKTGYSTDESVLSELLETHPVIQKLLEYRELYKLQSTYCEPLLALALKDPNQRVYTNFIHTGTATGRLSSKNPNLQNIPARGSLAKQMRSVFEARDGYSLISLDYSQIELRLLAHFSKDPALLEAFKNGEDIHARTAISIFGTSDPKNRAIAKSINFGLIYGMGANKLSGELGIDKKSAKEYIELYFKAFSTIKEFLESIKVGAKNDGFVTTLLGRKRLFDFSHATPMQVAMYEREAVNTKFQGSAADIIKLAMLGVKSLLSEDAKLLLQIHDELIFEVRDDLANDFANRVKELMQNAVNLNVPLIANSTIAKNWGELK
ncbi:DNA polymerase I, 5' --_ 3' polymerase, 5' --_ 3' and 3' --_ 5' exonuclease [Campylobacter iguaniorum]|uniref:DNA polymerase I n=1 Tax=Campylobacter iguaniorum TaxID=1244531 RepID=A0A076F768_9BACT|nr:DNA polymerase I [Campylobacter iguaniorum]AII14115.1 DNA polymerase I, 5' --> 3' polymerase, 5' --> 3' and 3' --> 5' exonuclease [Campylobacter iguaniorum]